ncbi:hotdog fold thioesterase [Flavobacteriaceae bacterium F08102]|nr:hotdog fold thioesterase [Flavobacteriaceae bacterium F08102]
MNTAEKLEKLNASMADTLMETLGITFISMNDNEVVATMPVTPKVHQPAGLLHGGASVSLAESVGSVAAYNAVDASKFEVRGLEITANHVRSIREGMVTATAKPIHIGRTTHLWEIRIVDEQDRLISICKLTTIVLKKK